MDEKIFAEQILDVIKANAFEIKKILLNLDDCVSKSELDDALKKISNLEMELKEKNSRLDEFNEKYSDLEQAISSYKNLSDETKFSLEGVFGTEDSPTSFLEGIFQEGHLESLFEFVATTMNNGTNSETEILRGLCDFGFNAVNSGRREKIFARLDVQVGDDFSSSTMRKTSDSPQLGTVKKILLDGYKYVRTNKVVKPSLVCLG